MRKSSKKFEKNKIYYLILFFILVIIVLSFIWILCKKSRENFEQNKKNDEKIYNLKNQFRKFFNLNKIKEKYKHKRYKYSNDNYLKFFR